MFRSIVFTTLLALVALAQAQKPNTGYNGGEDNPQDPSDAGAAGASKGAFTLSKGGLVAIIVVAVVVAVAGTASATLFWLAKKRQWDVRQSIRRASRRLTGRATEPSKRQNRRTGMRLDSPPPPRTNKQNRDVEKGLAASSQRGKTTTTITS
ncbi:uncharacterized protein EI97DRAFT_359462, partial [Westerdykella ornata]